MNESPRTFGGYLSLDSYTDHMPLSGQAHLLSSGRACIAAAIRKMRPERIHIPHYICDSVIDQDTLGGTQVSFYSVNEQLLPEQLPGPTANEMLLLVDYFGICTRHIRSIAEAWKDRCILDHSQAFFAEPAPGCWTFTSARKFFGVSDGALLFAPHELPAPAKRNSSATTEHLLLALAGHQTEGLAFHRINEAGITAEYLQCSLASQRLLEHTDREQVRLQRCRNFKVLHQALGAKNALRFRIEDVVGPNHYPLLLAKEVELGALHKAGIFAPFLWPEVMERRGVPALERSLAKRLVALPVDQRYDESGMETMLARVLPILERQQKL